MNYNMQHMEVYRYSVPPQRCKTEYGPGTIVEIEFSPFWWYRKNSNGDWTGWFRYGVILDVNPFFFPMTCFTDSEVTTERSG